MIRFPFTGGHLVGGNAAEAVMGRQFTNGVIVGVRIRLFLVQMMAAARVSCSLI